MLQTDKNSVDRSLGDKAAHEQTTHVDKSVEQSGSVDLSKHSCSVKGEQELAEGAERVLANGPKVEPGAKQEDIYSSLDNYFPHYLSLHRNPASRALHYAGNILGPTAVGVSVATGNAWAIPLAIIACGYGPAWIGHFFIENNTPGTFQGGPKGVAFAFISDWRMMFRAATGQLKRDFEKLDAADS